MNDFCFLENVLSVIKSGIRLETVWKEMAALKTAVNHAIRLFIVEYMRYGIYHKK